MSQIQQSTMVTIPQTLEVNSQISDYYKQIHKTIQEMHMKVEDVIKVHEAEFLFAYRNHIKKIKKQLADIKKKSEDQENMFSSNDRIHYLEKQLSIFREEALKLYDKLDAKTQEADLYKAKIKQSEKSLFDKECETKDLIRSAKLSQAGKDLYQIKIEELQQIIRRKDQQIDILNHKINNVKRVSLSSRNHAIRYQIIPANPNRHSVHQRTSSLQDQRLTYSNPVFKNTVYDSELKQWFLQCIRSVKREVAQRKLYSGNYPVDFSLIANIGEFRMVDKLRLLELFLENQKLLVWIYEKIFPDRLSEIKDQLSQSNMKQESTPIKEELENQLRIKRETKPPSDILLPRVTDSKWKRSVIRNRVQVKHGKINLSFY